jgi:hypothetical protein
MAGDRARAAARVLAGDAAATAAQDALDPSSSPPSRAAAKDTARAALAPTVELLRRSVFGLLDRMLPTEPLPGSPAGAPLEGVFTFSV